MRLPTPTVTLLALLVFLPIRPVTAQPGPAILIVTAHPDDEAMFAATVYRITHDLGGSADLALVTDGGGGYRFSVLGNRIYGLELTDPEVARDYLPAIRKRELMAGGAIIGIRNYFFLDQPDTGRTDDQDSTLAHVWDAALVARRLDDILASRPYHFVFVHLPIAPFHAHHKAATILAIEAVGRMDPSHRPVILGGFVSGGSDEIVNAFEELDGHPETRVLKSVGPFGFDRNTRLGLDDRLDYSIVVDWLIAEHKSQGTMQMFVGNAGVEQYWVFAMNGDGAADKAAALMRAVREAPVPR